LLYGSRLITRGIIRSVPYEGPFVNGYRFYRFTAHDSGTDPSAPPPPAAMDASLSLSQNKPLKKMKIGDFDIVKLLGTGAFGKVVLAQNKTTQKLFAIKVLDKKGMSEGDKNNTWAERLVLNEVCGRCCRPVSVGSCSRFC
jgi:serine/threonine protein kinase